MNTATERSKLLQKELSGNHVYLNDREKLFRNAQNYHKTEDTIRDSQKAINETQDIGIQVIESLAKQHEMLSKTQNAALNIYDNLKESDAAAGEIRRGNEVQKYIKMGILGIIMLLVLILLYFIFFK